MHAGPLAGIPLAADRALDLRRQLQQQPVIGLLSDRLNAERQAVLVGSERQRDRGDAAEIGERREGKIAPEVTEPSSTSGLSLIVRYSVVPTFGVGNAVIGVRMMSQSSKNAPKPRDVVLNTACIRARSAIAGVPAMLPDPDVDGFEQIFRRLLQAARGQHVGDDERQNC